jgi:hypothetical protein
MTTTERANAATIRRPTGRMSEARHGRQHCFRDAVNAGDPDLSMSGPLGYDRRERLVAISTARSHQP